MVKITFDVKYGGRSYGDDLEKALYAAAEDSVKKQITDKLRRVPGLENERVTIQVDLKSGKIEVKNISNPEAKQKIIDALK